MSLAPGTRFGPYEILGPLGAGGMGEVYRAKDTRLGREVAVKILPSHLSENPEVRERFEREARAISSLNHPHICTLYDVGREGNADYFVMELLEGESLAGRLERGPLKLDEALVFAAQIAEALAAAHRRGIVHRDLKPANVAITKSGAKVLDFGVAKQRDEAIAEGMTRTTPLTSQGAMLGTVQYMAPEQLEGKPVDHRADLFALGAVLYEMLTGKRAFEASSSAGVIAAILREEPRPVSELAPAAPPAVDRLVRSCLAKDPDQRWQSAGDLARELRWIAEGKTVAAPPSHATAAPRGRRERLAWLLAAAGLIAGVAGVGLAMRGASAPSAPPVTRFTLAPPAGRFEGPPAVSPDGRSVAFVVLSDLGKPTLWLHSFESGEPRLIQGSEGARLPFWSPDGKALAFFAEGRLKKVVLPSAAPQVLCNAADARGGTWGEQGTILFTPNSADGLFGVPATGGDVTQVTRPLPGTGEQSHRFPEFLPGGRRFVYTTAGSSARAGIYMASLDDPRGKRILPEVSRALYDRRGFLVFLRGGDLLAQRFDPERGALHGEAILIANDIGSDPQMTACDMYSISSDGALAFRTGSSQTLRFRWFDRAGKPLATPGPEQSFREPALSPDGRRVVAGDDASQGRPGAVWVFDLETGGAGSRLTFGATAETPIWSPDGKFVVYSSARDQGYVLARKPASGAGDEETLLTSKSAVWADDWSSDGRFILYEQFEPGAGSDLWVLPVAGDRNPVSFRKTPASESHAMFSPDGRYIAYVSDELGTPEVFVETFPASGSKWQVTSGGADMPAWRRDGKEIFYVGADRTLMSLEIKSLAPFETGARRVLFRMDIPGIAPTGNRTFFVATADGSRFLVNALAGPEAVSGMRVVLNWSAAAGR